MSFSESRIWRHDGELIYILLVKNPNKWNKIQSMELIFIYRSIHFLFVSLFFDQKFILKRCSYYHILIKVWCEFFWSSFFFLIDVYQAHTPCNRIFVNALNEVFWKWPFQTRFSSHALLSGCNSTNSSMSVQFMAINM